MKSNEMTTTRFFEIAINERLNPKRPKILCHRGKFYHKYKNFITKGILPQIEDKGLQVGAP